MRTHRMAMAPAMVELTDTLPQVTIRGFEPGDVELFLLLADQMAPKVLALDALRSMTGTWNSPAPSRAASATSRSAPSSTAASPRRGRTWATCTQCHWWRSRWGSSGRWSTEGWRCGRRSGGAVWDHAECGGGGGGARKRGEWILIRAGKPVADCREQADWLVQAPDGMARRSVFTVLSRQATDFREP